MVTMWVALQHTLKEKKHQIIYLDKCEMFLSTKKMFPVPICKLYKLEQFKDFLTNKTMNNLYFSV